MTEPAPTSRTEPSSQSSMTEWGGGLTKRGQYDKGLAYKAKGRIRFSNSGREWQRQWLHERASTREGGRALT